MTEHISKEEYAQIGKEMHADPDADLPRTPRKREVEACFGKRLELVLADLDTNCASRSAMLRQINQTLDANGVDTDLSRSTLYEWLGDADLR